MDRREDIAAIRAWLDKTDDGGSLEWHAAMAALGSFEVDQVRLKEAPLTRRYALFAGDQYYAGGGWEDFAGWCESLDAAQKIAALLSTEWAHVVDMETNSIVWKVGGTYGGRSDALDTMIAKTG